MLYLSCKLKSNSDFDDVAFAVVYGKSDRNV